MIDEHRTELPGTGWQVWRSALIRSAGFPVTGMARFAAPDLASVADRFLDGAATDEELAGAFGAATRAMTAAVYDTAVDPAFRAALTWQNPNALTAVASVLRAGRDAVGPARRRRTREDLVARYWQRYCLKNDTVGFFGPLCWTELGTGEDAVTATPGPGLVRDRHVHFEWWALAAVADRIAEDARVAPWLPVRLQPHLSVRDGALLTPHRPPQQLSAPIARLLALADRRCRVTDLVAGLLADPDSGFRRDADVRVQLSELAARGVLRIGFDLPMDLSAEDTLRAQLAGVDDHDARIWAVGELDALSAGRDAVRDAEGPAELATAMAALDERFTALTGELARRRPGEPYAGRTLCHLDTTRDLDVAFGAEVLRRLTPLEPLLRSARWLTAAIGAAYEHALTALYDDLAAETGTAEVPLADLWGLAQGVVFGADSPAAEVTEDFLGRWRGVLGLADVPAGTRELLLTTEGLNDRVGAAFPAEAPGWASARVHSPDLHLCATDQAALARGEFTVVLGELHIAMPAFDTHFFSVGHHDPAALLAAMAGDLPAGRVRLLLPADWPRHSARNAEWLHGPRDTQLGFVPAPGADPDRLVPITALTVAPGPHGLAVRTDDGRTRPILEVFAQLFDYQAWDTWKLAGTAGHTPRITVDGLVLVRETWRATIGETGLAGVTGDRDRYLAVRRWRRALGLPERVFVRVDTELKPCFLDLTSPIYTRLLCTLLRAALGKAGAGAGLTVTELLPGPDDAWLPDADGNRYGSELRLQIRDPALPLAR